MQERYRALAVLLEDMAAPLPILEILSRHIRFLRLTPVFLLQPTTPLLTRDSAREGDTAKPILT
jgi:hypothetical protein